MNYSLDDKFVWDRSLWAGVERFQCTQCDFTIFRNDFAQNAESVMLEHCRKRDHGRVKNGNLSIDTYIQRQLQEPRPHVIITLGYLCWNTRRASSEGAEALIQEAKRLRVLGNTVHIVIVDNGSDDGTYQYLCQAAVGAQVEIYRNNENVGIGRARNFIIDAAVDLDSDYLLMMDGDIEVVPLSVYQMARYLECHKELGCIGAYSSSYTTERKHASESIYEIQESRVKADIHVAWTQYGLFRCEMFRQGVRFDECGPFGEPGWGFEDDDLFMQMDLLGWANKYFGGMCYLHRNIRSSWPSITALGLNVEEVFRKRQSYLLNKWRQKGYTPAILRAVEAQHPPR